MFYKHTVRLAMCESCYCTSFYDDLGTVLTVWYFFVFHLNPNILYLTNLSTRTCGRCVAIRNIIYIITTVAID